MLDDGIGTAVCERALWTSVHQGKASCGFGARQRNGKRCHGVPGHFSGQVLPLFIECEIWYSDDFSLYVSGL